MIEIVSPTGWIFFALFAVRAFDRKVRAGTARDAKKINQGLRAHGPLI
jgi:hypothetical protein